MECYDDYTTVKERKLRVYGPVHFKILWHEEDSSAGDMDG